MNAFSRKIKYLILSKGTLVFSLMIFCSIAHSQYSQSPSISHANGYRVSPSSRPSQEYKVAHSLSAVRDILNPVYSDVVKDFEITMTDAALFELIGQKCLATESVPANYKEKCMVYAKEGLIKLASDCRSIPNTDFKRTLQSKLLSSCQQGVEIWNKLRISTNDNFEQILAKIKGEAGALCKTNFLQNAACLGGAPIREEYLSDELKAFLASIKSSNVSQAQFLHSDLCLREPKERNITRRTSYEKYSIRIGCRDNKLHVAAIQLVDDGSSNHKASQSYAPTSKSGGPVLCHHIAFENYFIICGSNENPLSKDYLLLMKPLKTLEPSSALGLPLFNSSVTKDGEIADPVISSKNGSLEIDFIGRKIILPLTFWYKYTVIPGHFNIQLDHMKYLAFQDPKWRYTRSDKWYFDYSSAHVGFRYKVLDKETNETLFYVVAFSIGDGEYSAKIEFSLPTDRGFEEGEQRTDFPSFKIKVNDTERAKIRKYQANHPPKS